MKFNKELLDQTLTLIGRDPDKFATDFYDLALSLSPDLNRVFRNTDLKLQKTELIKGFLIIFSTLEDEDKLEEYLYELGIRHLTYEVLPEHYPVIEHALLHTIRNLHGESWEEPLELEWQRLLFFITDTMLKGSRSCEAA